MIATEKMYDSVNVESLPTDARVYMGYVNGRFNNRDAVKQRFPRARVFGIDVLGNMWTEATILDFETGNLHNPAGLLRWAKNREAFRPQTTVIYCDRFNLRVVEQTLGNSHNGVWHMILLATLDGTDLTGQKTDAGNLIIGTQLFGGLTSSFDTSHVLTSWPFPHG
jgi:hypothetical protein